MTWGKVDDKLHSSPKWRAASKGARALWTTALSWSMDQLTDGLIPAHMVPTLDGTTREADDLVRVGLWETHRDGWLFHDWQDYQPSRAHVVAERDAAKERQRRARERSRVSRRDDDVTGGVSHAVSSVPPTRPDPTRTPVVLSVVGDGDQASIVTDVMAPSEPLDAWKEIDHA